MERRWKKDLHVLRVQMGISKIVYIFQWFAEKMRKGFWHWKWQITFKLLFSNLLWRFAEVFHAEFSTVVQLENCSRYPLLQLKALSLCEGCHYQRSWHVELRFGRPESHLRRALKPADLSTLRKMLESLDDVSQWKYVQIPFLWTCFGKCEVPNSGQNPGKNQQDVGEFCWSFYWVLNGGHGSRLKDRSCPKNDQLPHGMATFIEKLFESCHWTWVKPWFRKGFLPIPFCVAISGSRDGNPQHLEMSFPKWILLSWWSWTGGKTWCQFLCIEW